MLPTPPHFPLSSLAVLQSTNGDRQHTRNSPQWTAFLNANSDDYIDSYLTTVSRLKTKNNQVLGSDLTKNNHRNLVLTEHIEHGLPESQFNQNISEKFYRTVRVAHDSSSIDHIGSQASSPFRAKWLSELLADLKDLPAYAQDEDMAAPSEIALAKAKHLLEEISSSVIDRPDVYPMDERSIAIDFRIPERKSGVLFVIEQEGSGALYHRTENSRGRLRVDDAADLLSEGRIMELKRVGIR